MCQEIQLIVAAINTRTPVAFTYDDDTRVVEPHAIGVNKAGETIIRAFQVRNFCGGDGWRLFKLDKIEDDLVLQVELEGSALTPREGYRMHDSQMVTIIAQVIT